MSKTIKIIDLLNKIANGEEPPEKIRIAGHRYKYNKETKDYDSDIGFDNKDLFLHIGILKELNTPIIIEEQDEIDIQELEDVNLFDNGQNFNDMPIIIESYDDNFTNINNTINKLVRAVKQLDKNIKEK
jgi:hypothetical protein